MESKKKIRWVPRLSVVGLFIFTIVIAIFTIPIRNNILRHEGPVSFAAFSPDGKTVITGSWDSTACLWDVASGQLIGKPLQHKASVIAGAFSPDGRMVITGSWDSTACLWDVASGQLIGKPLQHKGSVISVAVNSDNKTAVTVSYYDNGATAQFWNILTSHPKGKSFTHNQKRGDPVVFNPDGKTLNTQIKDYTSLPWDVTKGQFDGKPLEHTMFYYESAFSPDGNTVIIAYDNGIACLWDVSMRRLKGGTLKHEGPISKVAFSSDGKTIITASGNSLYFWDSISCQLKRKLINHKDDITSVVFSPDGKLLITTSMDGTARLCKVP